MALPEEIRASGLSSSSLPKTALLLLCLAGFWLTGATGLHAATISGTVKDPSGAVVVQARIEITGSDLPQPLVFFSDGLGRFMSPDLKAGKYSLEATRDGFEPLVNSVDLEGPVELELTLRIARQQESISVPAKSLAFANSDPVYRQLRALGLGSTFRFDNVTLNWDAAIFQFQKGTLTFLSPVEGVVTGAIFVGEGHFSLKAVAPLDARELSRRTGGDDAQEDFTAVVFRFTRQTRLKFAPGLGDPTETPSAAEAAFAGWKEKMRRRQEYAAGFTQYVLQGETMDNVDADVLAAVYNPAHPEFLNAYLVGKKHRDLRFFVRTCLPTLITLNRRGTLKVRS